MTGIRRVALVLATTAVTGLGLASAATAATTTPGTFTFDVSTAKVGIGPVPSIPINAATLGGQPIALSGTVDANGRLSVPKDKVAFPGITIPIPQEVLTALAGALSGAGTGGLDIGGLLGGLLGGGLAPGASTASAPSAVPPPVTSAAPAIDPSQILDLVKDVSVTAGIDGTRTATGTIDPATGAAALDLGLGIGVGLNATASLGFISLPIKDLVKCGISPIDFKLTTGSVTVPGKATTLTGKPYDPATGLVTLVGAADTPAPGCKLNSLVGGLIGGGADPLAGLTTDSLGAATVELTGKLAVKAAEQAPLPPVVTTTTPVVPPAPVVPKKVAAALLKLAKTIKVTGKTVAIKIACQVLDCSGKVTLAPVTATSAAKKAKAAKALGTNRYQAKAGKTATVKVTLTKAARALLKKKHKAKVNVSVSVAGGSTVQRTVTLAAPAKKRK